MICQYKQTQMHFSIELKEIINIKTNMNSQIHSIISPMPIFKQHAEETQYSSYIYVCIQTKYPHKINKHTYKVKTSMHAKNKTTSLTKRI